MRTTGAPTLLDQLRRLTCEKEGIVLIEEMCCRNMPRSFEQSDQVAQ
jgi:hypothetical protein